MQPRAFCRHCYVAYFGPVAGKVYYWHNVTLPVYCTHCGCYPLVLTHRPGKVRHCCDCGRSINGWFWRWVLATWWLRCHKCNKRKRDEVRGAALRADVARQARERQALAVGLHRGN